MLQGRAVLSVLTGLHSTGDRGMIWFGLGKIFDAHSTSARRSLRHCYYCTAVSIPRSRGAESHFPSWAALDPTQSPPRSFQKAIVRLACLSGISHITCPLAIPDRRQVQDGTDVSPSVSGPAERDSGGQSYQILQAVLAQLSHSPSQALKPSHPGAESPCSVLHGTELHGPNSGTPLSKWPLLSLAADKDPARGGHISTAIRTARC